MSLVVRNPAFCIRENEDADQSVSIAQWLERRSSNPAVVRSSPGRRRTYVPAMLRS